MALLLIFIGRQYGSAEISM